MHVRLSEQSDIYSSERTKKQKKKNSLFWIEYWVHEQTKEKQKDKQRDKQRDKQKEDAEDTVSLGSSCPPRPWCSWERDEPLGRSGLLLTLDADRFPTKREEKEKKRRSK